MPTILPFWYRGVAVGNNFLKLSYANKIQDTCPWGAFMGPEPLDTVEWFATLPTGHCMVL